MELLEPQIPRRAEPFGQCGAHAVGRSRRHADQQPADIALELVEVDAAFFARKRIEDHACHQGFAASRRTVDVCAAHAVAPGVGERGADRIDLRAADVRLLAIGGETAFGQRLRHVERRIEDGVCRRRGKRIAAT